MTENPEVEQVEELEAIVGGGEANADRGLLGGILGGELGPLFERLTANEEDNDEVAGELFGSIFKTVKRRLDEPLVEGENPITRILQTLLGDQFATQAMQEISIKSFFQQQLLTMSMREAVVTTKEHFQLPDDYTLKLELVISFAPVPVAKGMEPDMD